MSVSYQLFKSKTQWLVVLVLFVLVFLTSVIAHIPAGWVLKQDKVANSLSRAHVDLSDIKGNIWQGQAQLSFKKQALGKVSWSLSPASLLVADLAVDLNWQYQSSNLSADASLNLFQPSEFAVSNALGVIQIKDAVGLSASMMPPSMTVLKEAEGKFNLLSLNSIIDLNSGKLVSLKGTANIEALELMGNAFPVINVEAAQEQSDNPLTATVVGEGEAWNLTGDATVIAMQRVKGLLDVKAASANDLPDWAFAMQKKSATHYQLKFDNVGIDNTH